MKGKKKKRNSTDRKKNEVKNIQPILEEKTVAKKEYNEVVFNSEAPTKSLTLLERLNKYSNLIVGGATVLLVIVTAIYIILSWKIANETKRLADITVEQFKIKSYPTFLFDVSDPEIESGKLLTQIQLYNKGELTVHGFSYLFLFVTKSENGLFNFYPSYGAFYNSENEMTPISYEGKITPNGVKELLNTISFTKDFTKEKLQFLLFFVKFKVPYDVSYSYESVGYCKTKAFRAKTKEYPFTWQRTSDHDQKDLIRKYFNNRNTWDENIRSFFEDYRGPSLFLETESNSKFRD